MLPDDLEALGLRNDILDVVDRVARSDSERGRIGAKALVLEDGERDRVLALFNPALTKKIDPVIFLRPDLLDPLVHLTEESLITSQAVFTVHVFSPRRESLRGVLQLLLHPRKDGPER